MQKLWAEFNSVEILLLRWIFFKDVIQGMEPLQNVCSEHKTLKSQMKRINSCARNMFNDEDQRKLLQEAY